MPITVTQYTALISCPSDVKTELDIIKSVIDTFNRIYGSTNNINIQIKHWSIDSYPESGGHPQKLLDQQFINKCDIAIAVFWTKFGSPTEDYDSGTQEEIEEFIKSGKQVFLYFSNLPIRPDLLNSEQYKKVKEFQEKYKDKGIYSIYNSYEEFEKQILNHLTLYFLKKLSEDINEKKKLI